MASYVGGVILIILGMIITFFNIREFKKNKNISGGADLRGWASGIGFLILGFSILVLKFLGKV